MIDVEFEPRWTDFVQASLTALGHRRWLLYLWVALFVVFPWALALWLHLAAARGAGWAAALMLAFPLVAAALFVGTPVLRARRAMRTVPTVQGRHHYSFSDEGIELTGPQFRNHLSWSAISASHVSRFGAMLFTGSHPLVFVPVRAFRDRDELRRWREFADARVRDAA